MFNNCFCFFLDNIPRQKAIHTRQAQSQVKVESSREPPGRFNSENALGLRLWRSTNTLLLPLVVATLLIFTVLQAVVFKATVELGREECKQCKLKCYKVHCLYQYSAFLFLYKHFPNYFKTLMNFLSFDKAILTLFASVLVAFMGRENFQRSLLHHFTDIQNKALIL